MVSLENLVKSLNAAYETKDYESCQKVLPAIKLELIKGNIFVPDLSNTNESYINDLNITKRVFEIGALSSVFVLDFDSFQNYFTQLRGFYFSSNATLSKSENKAKLISLYLLILLSQGDVTKFHSELEYLDKHIPNLEDDELLSYPIKVDRWLMEGLYQKAWELLETGLSIPEFSVFNKTLMTAIRDEIAHSTEMAYPELPLSSIKALLFFSSEKEAEEFALERGWNVANSVVKFDQEDDPAEEEEENEIDDGFEDDKLHMSRAAKSQLKVIENTLDYAVNLESIV